MKTRLIFVAVFIAGVGSGWLGKTWLAMMHSNAAQVHAARSDTEHAGIVQSELTANVASGNQLAVSPGSNLPANSNQASTATIANDNFSAAQDIFDSNSQDQRRPIEESSNGIAAPAFFEKLLNDRLYYDAMIVYQELIQQNEQTAARLRSVLLDHLKKLSDTRGSSNFSELIDSYLSIYYDDIEVLLLLADFNQSNGNYFEVVDVYLLAKTYAYTEVDQQNLQARFSSFIKSVDGLYTSQKNWLSLINLYSHINASGLMTSTYQYRQALANLRSGDEYLAVEQFRQLLNDSLVGESAAIALDKLTGNNDTAAAINNSVWEGSESIALQQVGNQYLVDLTVNRRDDIKLLIDTGASITTLSRASFNSLTTNGEAVKQDRRVFRTASGVIEGTVYSIPELSLGPYLMKNTQIAVLDFDVSRDIDGLLGMNILGQFRFQIDQENIRLLLSRQ